MNKIFIICVLVLVLTFSLAQLIDSPHNHFLVQFLEKNISKDGEINSISHWERSAENIIFNIGLIWAWIFLIYFVCWNDARWINRWKLKTRILYLFLFQLLFAFTLHIRGYRGLWQIYGEDHFFESFSAILFFLSAIILIIKLFNPGILPRLYLLAGAIILSLIGLEEISWGQRIFDWSTPDYWEKLNVQSETNLHNLLGVKQLLQSYIFANFILGIFFLSTRYLKSVHAQVVRKRATQVRFM